MFERWVAKTAAIAVVLGLAACSSSSGSTDDATPTTGDNPGGAQAITFWHSMAGKNGEALDQLVADFNAANEGSIHVNAVFQGKYNETLTKLKASIQSKQSPTLVQVFEIGTQIMVDTGAVIPFQDLAESNDIPIDELEAGVTSYYTVDGTLQALPFNASAPLLYFNKDAFEAAGLDPESPPTTWGQVMDAAAQLTKKDGSETTQYGMVLPIEGWFVEQMLAAGGVEYCDAANGREGRATTVTWNNDAVRSIVTGWADGVAAGDILNVGRNNSDAAAAFQAGRAAMIVFTSANLRDMIRESEFEVGVAQYVRPDGTDQAGVFNGGAAIWTMASASEPEQAAAGEFLKFMASPDSQAFWAAQTGYVPMNVKAVEVDTFTDVVAEYPAFTVAKDELAASDSTGCLLGTMPQARDKMNDVIESVVTGSADVDDAISSAQDAMSTIIGDYNASVG